MDLHSIQNTLPEYLPSSKRTPASFALSGKELQKASWPSKKCGLEPVCQALSAGPPHGQNDSLVLSRNNIPSWFCGWSTMSCNPNPELTVRAAIHYNHETIWMISHWSACNPHKLHWGRCIIQRTDILQCRKQQFANVQTSIKTYILKPGRWIWKPNVVTAGTDLILLI